MKTPSKSTSTSTFAVAVASACLLLLAAVAAVLHLPTASAFSTSIPQKAVVRPTFAVTVKSPLTNSGGLNLVHNNNFVFGNSNMMLPMSSDAAAAAADAGDDGNSAEKSSEAPPASSPSDEAGGATVTQLCFNLVKGIVGAGVLSLPAGIAAFANAPSAVVPAVALISIIGALSGYGFALIGRCCAYTGTSSYRDAWSATVSPKTSWLPATAVTLKTCFATLAYSMILGDTFVSLLSTAGIVAAKVPVTLGLTGAVLLPLCLMKNLSSLAPFSLVGSLGMLYTAIAMMVRYFGKAYVATGKFGKDLPVALRPSFGTVGAEGILTPSAAILVGMLSTAYMVRITHCVVVLFVCVYPKWNFPSAETSQDSFTCTHSPSSFFVVLCL